MTISESPNLDDLVQLGAGRISSALYVDPALFALEMERIFHGTWIYVAHESEIPEPGDYMRADLGLEECVVVRTRDRGIRVLKNACRHRGARVCNDACGNANFFRCGYHGWTYKNDGSLIGVPYQKGYGSSLERSELGLQALPVVESYRGFIFGSFDADVPPLMDYLKDVRFYLDRFIDQCGPYRLAALNGAQKVRYHGNWKAQLENAPDTYHAHATHKSFVDVLDRRIGGTKNMYNADDPTSVSLSFPFGHCVIDRRKGEADAAESSETLKGRMWNLRRRLDTAPDAERLIAELEETVPSETDALLKTAAGVGSIVIVFPNLILNGIHIRQIVPKAVDRTILRNVVMNPVDGPPAIVQLRLRAHELFYGPAGFAAPDDFEMFERVQGGLTGSTGEPLTVTRGLTRECEDGDARVSHGSDETTIRNEYREWLRLVSSGSQ